MLFAKTLNTNKDKGKRENRKWKVEIRINEILDSRF